MSAAKSNGAKGGRQLQPKAVKKTPARVMEKMIEESLSEIEGRIDFWYDTAQAWMSEQGAETRDAIERMTDIISRIYPKRFWVSRSRTSERGIAEISDEHHAKLSFYIAVESVKDLALMDIRVADFKFPDLCAECGAPVKSKKRRR